MVGGDDQRALDPGVLAAVAREAKPDQEARLQHEAREPVEDRVDPVLARVGVIALEALVGHKESLHGAAGLVTAYFVRHAGVRAPTRRGRRARRDPAGRAPSRARAARASRRGRRRGSSRSNPASPRWRRPPAELLDAVRRCPSASVPSAAASSAIAAGARSRIVSSARGSTAALVSACGVPHTRTTRLADDVVEREERRVERVGAEERAERERGAVALLAVLVERGRDQLGAAQRRHRRDRVARRACRAARRRAPARSSRSPAAAPRAGSSSRRGRRSRAPGARARGRCGPPGGGGSASSRRPRASSGSPRRARRGRR